MPFRWIDDLSKLFLDHASMDFGCLPASMTQVRTDTYRNVAAFFSQQNSELTQRLPLAL